MTPAVGERVRVVADRGDYGRRGVVLAVAPCGGSTGCVVWIDGVRTTVAHHDLEPCSAAAGAEIVPAIQGSPP